MKRTKRRTRKRIVHAFIPHPQNGFHPHLLRQTTVLLVVAGVLISQIGFLAYETVLRNAGPNVAAVLPGVVLALTNEARAEAASQPLAENPILRSAAQKKAEDMALKGYFAHQEPSGEMPWHWFQEEGYDFVYAGENLAVNFSDTKQLVDAWLASPTHKKNIVKAQYTDIGVGMATGTYKGREAVFVVQFFGSRDADPPPTFPAQLQQDSEVATARDAEVLGEEISNARPPVSNVQKLMLSPRTLNMQLLVVLLVAFAGILAIALVPSFRAHPNAIRNGFVVVAALVFMYSFQNSFLGDVEVPEESQAATASLVL
ncbi:hypothetical protein HY969_04685 [Candidatus Kaiserbacteria bacterium]|nr:hypothetical protein [Candidatus Kaiserbacteria bacterium]